MVYSLTSQIHHLDLDCETHTHILTILIFYVIVVAIVYFTLIRFFYIYIRKFKHYSGVSIMLCASSCTLLFTFISNTPTQRHIMFSSGTEQGVQSDSGNTHHSVCLNLDSLALTNSSQLYIIYLSVLNLFLISHHSIVFSCCRHEFWGSMHLLAGR